MLRRSNIHHNIYSIKSVLNTELKSNISPDFCNLCKSSKPYKCNRHSGVWACNCCEGYANYGCHCSYSRDYFKDCHNYIKR